MREIKNKIIYLYGFFSNLYFDRALWILYLISVGYSLSVIVIFQIILNVAMTVGEIPSGYLADKLGFKKVTLFGRLLIIFYMVSMILYIDDVILLGVAFAIYGLAFSMLSGTDQSYIYAYSKKKKKDYSSIFSKYAASTTISLGIAYLMSGLIVRNDNYVNIYIFSICFQLISFFLITTFEKVEETASDEKVSLKGLVVASKNNKRIFPLMFTLSFIISVYSVLMLFYQQFLFEDGYELSIIPYLYFVHSIIVTLTFSFYDKINKFVKLDKKVGLILLVLLVCFGSFFLIEEALYIHLIFLLLSVFMTFLYQILNVVMHNSFDDSYRNSLISIYNFIESLIMSAIVFISGYFGDTDMHSSLMMLGVIGVVFIFFQLLFSRKSSVN